MNAVSLVASSAIPTIVAGVAGFSLAVAGRRRHWLMAAACAAAAAAGWWLLVPWRTAIWPRGALDHMVLPALVLAAAMAAGVRLGSAWPGRLAVGFGGWWLAGTAAARPEFWRVWFAACVGAWVLRRLGAAAPGPAAAAALCVAGIAALYTAPAWVSAGLVAAAAAAAMRAGSREVVVAAPAVLMLLIVGLEIGLGQAVRGRVGLIETGCAASVIAPWLTPRIERWIGRRLWAAGPVIAPVSAPVVAAALLVGLAWVVARALR